MTFPKGLSSMTDAATDPRYPIGPFDFPSVRDGAWIARQIDEIEALPDALREVVTPLDEAQLATPYRDGGWTVRQVVHHLADSHMNSVVRFKWALTEEHPTIKAYDEKSWAELPDTSEVPISVALAWLDALHTRWVGLLRGLEPVQWRREFHHPESGADIDLATNVGVYAWHGRHHLAHITELLARRGW